MPVTNEPLQLAVVIGLCDGGVYRDSELQANSAEFSRGKI
jgi:hypothetical protein